MPGNRGIEVDTSWCSSPVGASVAGPAAEAAVRSGQVVQRGEAALRSGWIAQRLQPVIGFTPVGCEDFDASKLEGAVPLAFAPLENVHIEPEDEQV